MSEKWGWVIGMESKYEISTLGRVRSYMKIGGNHTGRNKMPRQIKPCMDSRGYYNFTVVVEGKKKTLNIHIEEAKSFIPNPNNYKIVRHLNDIKADNSLHNLAWGTATDNRNDGILNGKHFHQEGKSAAKSKLTESEVTEIFSSTDNNCAIGRRYGVTESTISKIKLGRTWNRITGLPYAKSDYRKRKTDKRLDRPTRYTPNL